MPRFAGITCFVGLAALLAACSGSSSATRTATDIPPPGASPVATVQFDETQLRIASARTIDVEIASTPAQSERGLGYRDALPPDAGMLFDLHDSRIPVFWMKGMRFALDMVWIGEDERVAGVTAGIAPEPGVPDDRLKRYGPEGAVRYVLELNAGAAERLGITTGAQLSFELP